MAWLSIFWLAAEILAAPVFAKDVVFPKGTLRVGGQTLTVEIAKTGEQLEHGLMFRENLKDDAGMIFIFDREDTLSFWMKNTLIDLDIGYFDAGKKLVDIQTMKAAGSVLVQRPPSYPSKSPAMYALEVNKGWFARHGIKTGAVFTLDDGRGSAKPRSKSAR